MVVQRRISRTNASARLYALGSSRFSSVCEDNVYVDKNQCLRHKARGKDVSFLSRSISFFYGFVVPAVLVGEV